MTIDFLKPARMDDVLEIVTKPEEVKGASILLRQQVLRGEELLVEANVRVAFVSGGRATPIPKPLRIAMRPIRIARTTARRTVTVAAMSRVDITPPCALLLPGRRTRLPRRVRAAIAGPLRAYG